MTCLTAIINAVTAVSIITTVTVTIVTVHPTPTGYVRGVWGGGPEHIFGRSVDLNQH